jgi:hypothetical protein
MRAKYKHTNLIAGDWKKFAAFYEKVFGCTPVPHKGPILICIECHNNIPKKVGVGIAIGIAIETVSIRLL